MEANLLPDLVECISSRSSSAKTGNTRLLTKLLHNDLLNHGRLHASADRHGSIRLISNIGIITLYPPSPSRREVWRPSSLIRGMYKLSA